MFPIVEKFISINGESAHAGELAVFIRFRGCNLKCSYCDTSWANSQCAEADFMTADQIAKWVKESGVKNVTLTGGEPLLQKGIEVLIDKLVKQGNRVEIETNGSIDLKVFDSMESRPVFTMDYKLGTSGMESHMIKENFRLLKQHDTVKFVSGSYSDLERAVSIISEYSLTEKCHVYISPVFDSIEPSDIVEFMIERGLNDVRLQLQMHKFIWEPCRKGV